MRLNLNGSNLMNLRAKFLSSIALIGPLCLMRPGSLQADTVYTYTGNPYTSCSGTYTCTGTGPFISVTLDVALPGVALDNLSVTGSDITQYVSSFSFSDGTGLSINQTNGIGSFRIGTDANGNILQWEIFAFLPSPGITSLIDTRNSPVFVLDESHTAVPDGISEVVIGQGTNISDPGTWNKTIIPTPELSTWVLFGSGLLGLAVLAAAARRKSQLPRTP